MQYSGWEFDSTIVQSPQLEQDLQWFELDNLGDFAQLNESQNAFLDSHEDNTGNFPDMGVNDQFSANNETDVTIVHEALAEAVSEIQHPSILLDQSMHFTNKMK